MLVAPSVELVEIELEGLDFLEARVQLEVGAVMLSLQDCPLALIMLIVLLLGDSKRTLLLLDQIESVLRACLTEYGLLQEGQPAVIVLEMVDEVKLDLAPDLVLDGVHRLYKLLDLLLHRKIRHEAIDFQLPLPGKKSFIGGVLDFVIHVFRALWVFRDWLRCWYAQRAPRLLDLLFLLFGTCARQYHRLGLLV